MTNNHLTDEFLASLKGSADRVKERGTMPRGFSKYLVENLPALLAELQERRKADSEPVAYTDEAELNFVNDMACMWTKGMGINEVPLYRHAQPAPVVPDEIDVNDPSLDTHRKWMAEGWNRCRAAMLQGAENVESRCGIQTAPALDSFKKNAESRCGNSPVIPDGLIAAVNRLLDSDGSRGCYSAIQCGDAHDEIERLLAAAPQEVKP
ncbi:TPA: hypothetical protein ACP41M_001092 [Klebsiella aerogenes]